MNNLNLLELCLSADLGGLELYMAHAAKALHEEFNVISIINPKGKLEQYYQDTSLPYDFIEKKSNIFMLGAAQQLAKIIDKHSIDIIHIHWTKDIPLTILAKKISKKNPKIIQTRHMTMTRFKNDFYHRFLYKNIDMILAVTHQVADQIHKFIPSDICPKVETLYMGFSKTEMLNTEEIIALRQKLQMNESFSIGLIGRIEETKGQHLLIDAVKQLRQEEIDVKAFFVGHPMNEHYLETLKQKARDQQMENAVHFLGFMKNPHHFMQVCDVVVLATEHETFGLVLIEAMHMGTAVIGSNRGGVLEIIDDNVTGLLFESMDSNSLAEKIKILYENPLLRQRLTTNGQTKACEQFSNELHFKKLSKILKEL